MIQNKMYEKLINFFNQKDYDKVIDEYSKNERTADIKVDKVKI